MSGGGQAKVIRGAEKHESTITHNATYTQERQMAAIQQQPSHTGCSWAERMRKPAAALDCCTLNEHILRGAMCDVHLLRPLVKKKYLATSAQ